MSTFRRTLPTLLTLLAFVLAGLLGSAIATTSRAHADTVTTTTTTVVETVSSDPGDSKISDDDVRFNPCTMGVNGEYPETDSRHYVPGPCDLSTVLPYDLRFQLVAEMVEDSQVTCAAGRAFTQIVVLVVDPDVSGAVYAEKYGYGCADMGDPFGDFSDVLPGMYVSAAAQLDSLA